MSASNRFKSTFIWWFTTLFGRLGVLFAVAASVLVFGTYYIVNWAVAEKDNILDAHDAYYHYQFVQSWGDVLDTTQIKKELDNLRIFGSILYLNADTLCTENYVYNPEKEKNLTFWSNIAGPFSFCDYISYQDSDYLTSIHNISIPEYVSFGDLYIKNEVYPATLIENNPWQVLLMVDYAYPKKWFTFLPIMFLSILFMAILFLFIWRFLQPINIMQKRIIDLEKGDLDSKIKIKGKDELAVLSQNFNNLTSEIKHLLKQKDRLLSEVSHEFRTPLAKIRLLLEMIRPENRIKKQQAITQAIFNIPRFGKSIKKEAMDVEDKINKIDKQVDYLDTIIKNVLVLDTLDAPYANLKIENISIENLVIQAIDLSKNKNVKTINVNKKKVSCDVVKLSIVIRNLLDNARKYAPSKRPVEINSKIQNDTVFISVRDFGPGVDEELLKNITKAYVRGRDRSKPGFGLGLSICKKVMESHNGSLKIENMEDGGCLFTISWPFRMTNQKGD